MKPLVAFDLWKWVAANRHTFEPPVGNKVIWEDSQFTAMIIRGPNARRDFHVDPSDEIFYMLKGDMDLEYMQEGRRQHQTIREGELLLHVADIERELKAAIERFDASRELRTSRRCGYVQPEQPPVPDQRPAMKA